ncbi:unnamed protein product [Cylindrotheca closterium]|uniref:Uncharacterized protein n=1 Tax=Cylindrotheca closterium TaxID=2856 RepID=A0AAD2JNZ2_9STRA|nr:unnamed protein product [Cylindrotheca closterium]
MIIDRSFTDLTANTSASYNDDEESSTSTSSGEKKEPQIKTLRNVMSKTASMKFSAIEEEIDGPLRCPMRQLSHNFLSGLLESSDSDISVSLRFVMAEQEDHQPLHIPMRQLSKSTSRRLLELSMGSDLSASTKLLRSESDRSLWCQHHLYQSQSSSFRTRE